MARPIQCDEDRIARIRAVCEAHERDEEKASIARTLKISRNTVAKDIADRQRAAGTLEEYLASLAPTGAPSATQLAKRERERDRKRTQRARTVTLAAAPIAQRICVSDIKYDTNMPDDDFDRWDNFQRDTGRLDTDAVRAHLARRVADEADVITLGKHTTWTVAAIAEHLPEYCTEWCEVGHTSSVDFYEALTLVLTKWKWCVDAAGVWSVPPRQ